MATTWGIPDWRDRGAYGDVKRWSESRWRWEFLRRREDCRGDFLAHADETLQLWREVREMQMADPKFGEKPLELLYPHEPGFAALVPDCCQKYGLDALPNPAIGEQPPGVLMFRRSYGSFYRGWGADFRPISIPDGKIAILFDLSKPVERQLLVARKTFQTHQAQRFGKLVRPGRRQPAKWLSYLRVLDAREAGASWSEIAKSDVLDRSCRADLTAARDAWRAARALEFKWPDLNPNGN